MTLAFWVFTERPFYVMLNGMDGDGEPTLCIPDDVLRDWSGRLHQLSEDLWTLAAAGSNMWVHPYLQQIANRVSWLRESVEQERERER